MTKTLSLLAATLALGLSLPAFAQEGPIVVYNAQHETLAQEWATAFTEETGIPVTIRQGSDLEVANQILQEGANSPADVFLTENSPGMVLVDNAKLFAPLPQDLLDQVPAQFRPANGDWTGIAARSTVFAYNTDKLTDADLPKTMAALAEPEWKGKSNGRSADSVINTTLIHLYRYAKLQAKQAISDTAFSTPDDFIYLITLVSNGSMSKTALIKLNVHEKSVGIQIINRLINNGLVEQSAESIDKRSRMIHITPKGSQLLNESMQNIRNASSNVTEPLTYPEKMDLIRLLAKLEDFHEQKLK